MKHLSVILILALVFILANCSVNITDSPPSDPQPTEFKFLNKLLAKDRAASDYFGLSVALSADGNAVIVGAYQDDDKGTNSGSAYIYKKNSAGQWEETKLIVSTGAASDYFGYSVALSADGNTALVGAYADDDAGTDAGTAFIFRYNSSTKQWGQEKRLTAKTGVASANFGRSVALSADGNIALIGATGDTGIVATSGSAYLFKWYSNPGAWYQVNKFTAEDGAASDNFGCSVALSEDGSAALIGTSADDDKGTDSGSAYIYKWINEDNLWVPKKLVPTDGAASDYFGRSVALSADGKTAVIGANGDDDKGTTSGSAYVYHLDTEGVWTYTKLVPTDGAASDNFGYSVAISAKSNLVLVGAYSNDDKGTDSGSAYVYTWNGATSLWDEKKLLADNDGAASDYFGRSVAIAADCSMVLIGAYADDDGFTDVGSAYLFNYQ